MRALLLLILAVLAGWPIMAAAGDSTLLTLAFSANTYGTVNPCPS